MTDRPILFSAPMVRALLDGRKTQTRRVIKPQPSKPWGSACIDGRNWWTCESLTLEVIEKWTLPAAPGDRLWVREACATWEGTHRDVVYRTDETDHNWGLLSNDARNGAPWKRRPSIHMPRWASRLTLTVTDVRVQRLQDISNDDAISEGIKPHGGAFTGYGKQSDIWMAPYDSFASLWNSLHGHDAWDANPWVCALTFSVQCGNIDQLGCSNG